MFAFTLHQWLTLAVPITIAAATILWQWRYRARLSDATTIPKLFHIYQDSIMNDSAGTPSLQQLTQGMKLDAKTLRIAEALYELGLEQYNHPINNRDGIIQESRKVMVELAATMNLEQLRLADGIGRQAAASEDPQQEDIDLILSPAARTYAQHKKREWQTSESIANDLRKNVPRTDYTLLKDRISSGETKLEYVDDEFPIIWESIRELNEKIEMPEVKNKPPKQAKVIAVFHTGDGRKLRDKRAEIDGDWLTSHTYNFLTPCPRPIQIFHLNHRGEWTSKGKKIYEIRRDPSSEWLTEFWRRGGYMDDVYRRAKAGMLPRQLRQAYRRRIIRKVQWSLLAAGVIANIAIFIITNS